MSVNIESLHKILTHPIRRKIVLALLDKKELTYIDLMNTVGVTNTGKLNYHLKILGDLIEKNDSGKYHLTEKGHLVSQILQKFPEKASQPTPLRGGDAILIGFVGFLLILLNPGFWGFSLILMLGMGIIFLGVIYALMVPSGVMWWLTIRRTNSHDLYDLFKPPLVSFALIMLLLIFMILLNIRVTINVQYQNSEGIQMAQPTIPSFLMVGLFFPFLGVGISETIYRIRKKGT